MTHAFLFPGQGSQSVGMGKELYDNFTEAKEVFNEVDDALDQSLSRIIFEGSIEALTQTSNTQPALMAVSIAVIRVLEKQSGKTLPDLCRFVAGHSLGEYSALCAADALSLSQTARLLRVRGNAMQDAVPAGQGGMAALIGVDTDQASTIAKAAAQGETCQIANDNGGGQVVISGHIGAIDRAVAIAAEHGAKKAIKLPVSAPFHCELIAPAAAIMREALAQATVNPPSVPLIANVTAAQETDPENIRTNLVKQITGTVRWRETIETLKAQNIDTLIECGAGKVLSGLTRRIDRSFSTLSLQTPADIEAFITG
jgi:[acyl-carrier-protein] S-malonyltransferase